MKQTINVLLAEVNEYYNCLISSALQQSIHFFHKEVNYELVFYSFNDSHECMKKIESSYFKNSDIIAFVDSNMGNGISGAHLISQLRKENSNTVAVLLTQSRAIGEKGSKFSHDYFVTKDTFAPALCRLYLDQYIENKFY